MSNASPPDSGGELVFGTEAAAAGVAAIQEQLSQREADGVEVTLTHPDCTAEVGTMPGPDGLPIPLVHFDDHQGEGTRLAVSIARGHAVLSTGSPPNGFDQVPVMLSPVDRKALAHLLLREDM